MAILDSRELERFTELLKKRPGSEIALADMVTLASITAETLKQFAQTIDSAAFRELRAIADYITRLHKEIGALQANDLRRAHIPAAGQELDAIVRATESASNIILECAEEVMAADASDPQRYKALVEERMLSVIEACSFQDLTGQRIAKVVETLKRIEIRVARFAEATKVDDARGFANDEEAAAAERSLRVLRHGPPLADEGNSQEAIDRIIREND